jgi:hypothetical protein
MRAHPPPPPPFEGKYKGKSIGAGAPIAVGYVMLLFLEYSQVNSTSVFRALYCKPIRAAALITFAYDAVSC